MTDDEIIEHLKQHEQWLREILKTPGPADGIARVIAALESRSRGDAQ